MVGFGFHIDDIRRPRWVVFRILFGGFAGVPPLQNLPDTDRETLRRHANITRSWADVQYLRSG